MSTFWGIGTKLYGRGAPLPDTSYVTTEWFVVLDLPVLPLRSMRILPGKKRFLFLVIASSRSFEYRVLEGVPLRSNIKQILRTCALGWGGTIGVLAILYYLIVTSVTPNRKISDIAPRMREAVVRIFEGKV